MNINRLLLLICLSLSTLLNVFAQFPEEPPEFAWVEQAGGIGSITNNDVVSDASGNIYVTGLFSGTVILDTTTLTSTGRVETFVAKYNPSGNLLWIRQVSCPEHELVSALRIAIDDLDNLYITGYYDAASVDFGSVSLPASEKKDLFVAKYTTNGTLQWANRSGDILDNLPREITIDASGNSYIIQTDGDEMHATSIIKYNTNGTFQWEKDVQASCRDLAAYNSNLYITGGIFSSGDIVIGDTTIAATGKEVFIAKIDVNGSWGWVKILVNKNELYRFVSLAVKSLQIDNSENIYIYGYYEDWIASVPDTLANPNEDMWYDLFLAKFNSSGTLQWITGSGLTTDYGFSMRLPYALTLDDSGNPYLFGMYGEIGIFGNDTLKGGWQNFISKYSSDGTPLWGKLSPGYASRMINYPGNKLILLTGWIRVVDYDLQELLTITTEGNGGTIQYITIDKDAENSLLFQCYSGGATDFLGEKISGINLLIGKSDPSGNLSWIKSFKGTGSVRPLGIVGDKYGDCYVTGRFYDTLKLDGSNLITKSGGFYILKLTSSGELVWSEQFIATSESYPIAGIITDTSGNIIITGSFYDSLIVGSDTLLTSGNMDIFIIKVDNQGNFLWTESFGGPGSDICNGVSTSGNDIIITGYFGANIFFGGTELIFEGGNDIFITKLDPDGSAIWAKQAGGSGDDRSYSIVTDAAGDSYISGYSSGGYQYSFDAIDINPNKNYQFFIAKYNSIGNAQWANNFESAFQIYPAYQSGLDNQGNIYVGGIFLDTLDADESNKLYSDDGNTFIAKYAPGGSLQWAKNFGLMNATMSFYNIDLAVIGENTIYAGGIMNAGKTSFDDITVSSGVTCGIFGLIGGVITIDNISSTPVLCYGDSTGSITVTASSTTGSIMYSLDDGLNYQDSNVFDSLPAGDYQVKIKDASGLFTNGNISVMQPDSVTVIPVITDVDCSAGTFGSIDLTVTGGSSPYSFLWSNDSIKQDITGLSGGDYSVLITDHNGCTKTGELVIGYSSPLEIEMENSAEFCAGDSTVLSAPEGYAAYEWSDMTSGNRDITVNTSGDYWVKVTAENGCTDTDTVIVTENPNPVTDIMDDETICHSEIQEFSLGADAVAGYSYSWTSDPGTFTSTQSNPKVTPGVTTVYTLTEMITSTGCHSIDSVTIIINPDPAATVLADQALCESEIREFQIGASAVTGNSYSWTSNPAGFVSQESNPTVTPENSITYILTETIDATGCSLTDSVTFTLKSNPVIQVQASSNPISMSENTILTASGANSYKWTPINKLDNPFNYTVTADPDTNTTYTVTGTGANGCTATKQIRVFVYCFNCGEVILFDTEGTLNHGCSNNNYNNNAICSWTLFPSGAENIYMEFSKFDIKPGDILKIYNGQNANAPLIGSYDNNNKPPYQIQTGSIMFIQFISDQNITGEGFEADFWTDQTNGYNGHSGDKDLIIYPNPFNSITQIRFPNPANEEYTMIITDLSGKVLKIIGKITGSFIDLDCSGLSKGIYLLELRGSEIYRGKIVLE